MRGIILAGGRGTRLAPMTAVTSKQLLPIYDKPMAYYPLSVLMLAGVRDILLISTPEDLPGFRRLLGDGSGFGCRVVYAEQPSPDGLAQAFIIGEPFIGGESCVLILGDNLFYGGGFHAAVRRASALAEEGSAVIFAYRVKDPTRYGVVRFDGSGAPASLEEKPARADNAFAIPGLYFYGPGVAEEARAVKPSPRGELEITDLNRRYLERGRLLVERLGRGVAWLDTGTPESLHDAAAFVQSIQDRQGLMIACIEEIAFDNGWIGRKELAIAAERSKESAYGRYLRELTQRA